MKKHEKEAEAEVVDDILILDDDSDMVMFSDTPFFLQVDANVGFDYYALQKALDHFKTADNKKALTAILMDYDLK